MGLETGTYVGDLVATNPLGTDTKDAGDNHLRLIKSVLQATFPNASRALRFASAPAAKTSAYTIVAADENALIRGDVSSGAFTITLPLGSTVFAGYTVVVMKSDSGGNVLTVDGSGAETVNGQATIALGGQFDFATLLWDGTEWKRLTPLVQSNRNAVINGGCRVAQRGALTLVKDVYGFGAVDRFEGMATGTAVSAGTLTQATAAAVGRTGYAVQFSGVTLTGTGQLFLRHRIEARDAATFKNQAATFSVAVRHDVGSAVTWTVTVRKANAADNFSATTDIGNDGGTSVATAASTRLVYTVADMGDVSNGVEVEIKIAAGAVTAKNFWLAELQLEVGISPTVFAHRDFASEAQRCRRYYERINAVAGTNFGVGWFNAVSESFVPIRYVEKRAAPTIAVSAAGDFDAGIGTSIVAVTGLVGQNIDVAQANLSVSAAYTGRAAGDAVVLKDDGTGNAWISMDAEL